MDDERFLPSWSDAGHIVVPQWLLSEQRKLSSRVYASDRERMALVHYCAEANVKLAGGMPLAAAVYHEDGSLISVGVDGEGIGGHEMTNALILGSNLRGSRDFCSLQDWDLFSLAPPCLICLGNICTERPRRFSCSVSHEELLSMLDLPNTPMPSPAWKMELEQRSIAVDDMLCREEGFAILKQFGTRQSD